MKWGEEGLNEVNFMNGRLIHECFSVSTVLAFPQPFHPPPCVLKFAGKTQGGALDWLIPTGTGGGPSQCILP